MHSIKPRSARAAEAADSSASVLSGRHSSKLHLNPNPLSRYWSLNLGLVRLFYSKFQYILSPRFVQTLLREKTQNLRTCARGSSSACVRDGCLFYGMHLIGFDTLNVMQVCSYHRDLYWTITLIDFSPLEGGASTVWTISWKEFELLLSLSLFFLGLSDTVECRHLLDWTHWMKMTPKESAAFIAVLFHCLMPGNGKHSSFKFIISHLSCVCVCFGFFFFLLSTENNIRDVVD